METLKSTLTLLLIFLTSFILNTYIQAQDAGNYPTSHEVKLVEGRKRQLLLLPPAVTNTVVASDLKPGEKYLLVFNKEKGNTTCNPTYRVINGTDSISFFDTRFDFIAKSKKITIEIIPGCDKSYSTRLGMYVSLAITGEHVDLIQQLNKKTKGTPEDVVTATSDGDVNFLISDVFIGGGCFDVTGVSPIGSAIGMGTFDGGGSSIQIESGVIITCGNATIANGPNDGEGSGASNGGGSDADLLAMGGTSIYDATGIQFDFKPTINLVQFNYVFGSDEYEEYTCSNFNDVFGFFIDGPSLNKNIALIPSTTLPVKINNVNQGSPGSFGTIANCTPPAGSLAYSGFYISNPVGSSDVEYDGFTTVFTAESAVYPCSTYHIKLIIVDDVYAIFD